MRILVDFLPRTQPFSFSFQRKYCTNVVVDLHIHYIHHHATYSNHDFPITSILFEVYFWGCYSPTRDVGVKITSPICLQFFLSLPARAAVLPHLSSAVSLYLDGKKCDFLLQKGTLIWGHFVLRYISPSPLLPSPSSF